MFDAQHPQEIKLDELDDEDPFLGKYNPKELKFVLVARRVFNFSDLRKYMEAQSIINPGPNFTTEMIMELKSKSVIHDAQFLKRKLEAMYSNSLKKITYQDMFPGDMTIAYELKAWAE